ncbi:nucleotide exchange factor GrpE [Gilliamella sp. B3791]|uniref:nucleotide exchange factor GrpE n=1 Tax=unclassified Gilliamella TaxID=2685620 RepID=UPI00226980D8|nr:MULTISPECIES: nucleotide exchange factor GrpE [unclassified Gilliamella]MCX8642718.1 nucleotide exchange factor GrpE [Gilliamella sp. B3835]MCX8708052.1 nucleotide exchange factor GrpE [Gilliamella sp. B3783]MCX8709058.1 nucleotide exchange factor GrpE [Gilliamella sp. B3780]MCX8712606.1 nucleotide exchange factor GrpE [Gilliamella sp. B3468]MCX8717247.1 nucleotide exchange factor GrpE [Gilliamella sp. B3784]
MTEQDKNMSENESNIDTATESSTEQATQAQPNVDEQLKAKDARIAELEQELQIAKKNESEAMIRARAEIDNVRKRVEQDVDKARKFALEKFSNELLPVIDNLERALESTDKDNPQHQAMVEGLELTLKSFLDTVKKFGIEVINTQDSQLNPDLHQAISMVESPEHQSGQIVNTIQKGYTLNGRLIRPAMVIVAK